ncbi:hypothetical protein [Devosia rhizoryzae]|uniref:Uncharacterized protein n=1 Tax=Devosia rhizoryzae TaxID=2774137 RepID=A0ABX7C5X1_9HYPH|nr:hypothetical protein [Devosia rhizoryzae]QQR39649.1 hypothetical protein JI748_01110 [Devosia rhizoryzae]
MLTKTIAMIGATLMLSSAVLAQDVEHRIGGKTVPEDQIAEVQEQCDAMRQGEVASPVAQAAYDEDSNEAAAEAAEDTAVDLAAELWSENGQIDPMKLSLELCDEGNFQLSAPN